MRLERAGEALWPHVDSDYALKSLTTTLHRLRKEFAEEDALLVADGELSLNRAYFWLDTWAFEQSCDAVFSGLATNAQPRSAEWLIEATRAALAHYHGPLLADSEAAWAVAPRERHRSLLQRLLNTAGVTLEKQGRSDEPWPCIVTRSNSIRCVSRCIDVRCCCCRTPAARMKRSRPTSAA